MLILKGDDILYESILSISYSHFSFTIMEYTYDNEIYLSEITKNQYNPLTNTVWLGDIYISGD